MPTRVAINGFGRIGRNVLRAALARDTDLEIVAVNDLTSPATLAQLLRYDSTLGRLGRPVEAGDDHLIVDGSRITVLAERDPAALPWGELGVDIVLESTGRFTSADAASAPLDAGAGRVLVSAASTGADVTIAYGVNHQQLNNNHGIVSNASCTTNCLAPMVKVLHETVGIEKGWMTTVHSYTNDQQLLDLPHKDLRRARAAALSIIPTTTGAALAVGEVLPHLQGKVDGISVRAPVPTGSITDLVVTLRGEATADSVNAAFKAAAESGPLAPYLDYSTEPLVSRDIVHSPASCIFDSELTMASGSFAKVFGWYDNEWGYSCRLVDLVSKLL
jgi:glyceraldehyde 3-phosphate dehydrogenase